MKFVFQWHITEKCNYRCKHCYQSEYNDDGFEINTLKNIFHQFLEIHTNSYWQEFNKKYINFVGGEPFLKKEFPELLNYINTNAPKKQLHIWILTNGSLLNQEKIDYLKSLSNISFHFQISIEGDQIVNDSIRGKWTYKSIIQAIELCTKNNFPLHLSFTLTKLNQDEIMKLIPLIEKHNLRIKIRRLVPTWTWNQIWEFMLSPKEWYIFSLKIHKINFQLKNWFIDLWGCSEVTWYSYNWDGCAINHHRLLVLNHDGEIYPCKRLEISLWNIKEISLRDAFFWNEYKKLLSIHDDIEICNNCNLKDTCRWGAKCITYAVEKTLKKPDPQCYKSVLIETALNKC